MSIVIMLFIALISFLLYRDYKAEHRFYLIREAVRKAYDNADPDLNHDTLDELITDIWEAMYRN